MNTFLIPTIISILILGIFGLSQESHAVQTPEFLFKFGTFGSDNGTFKSPTGLAFDNSDNLYVVENGNWRVQKFDDQGNFLLKWGSLCRLFNAGTGCIDPDGTGSLKIGDGQFADPFGIEVDSNDKVYVSDKNNRRIQIFDSTGNLVLKFGERVCDIEFPTNPGIQCIDPDGTGPLESGDGQFQLNRDVDVDDSGNIYVADSENDRIQVFDSQGNYLFKFGTKCTQSGFGCIDSDGAGPLVLGDGQFHSVRGIQIDSNGDIYVADWDNHRIQVFDSNGNFLTKFGKNGGDRSSGSGDGEFVRPNDIAFDSNGNVYVADSYNHRIQVFDSNHNFLTKFGSFGTDDGLFKFPTDLEIHNSGTIYVADPGNHRIQVFDPINASPDCSNSSASKDSLWPPNHKFVDIIINGVIDPDGDTVTLTITGITQDEAVDAKGSGNTSPDGEINGDAVKIRSERSGKGDGRVYEISFSANDGLGGVCSGSVNVIVPQNQSGTAAVDNGQNFDSTQP